LHPRSPYHYTLPVTIQHSLSLGLVPENPSTYQTHAYDVIIIGASIAGCMSALELANKGWRVAVLEKRQSLQAYKKICTHIIHPYAVNKLKEFGVLETLLNESAQMTAMNIHHQDLSVLFPFKGKLDAANIERSDLDPALRATLLNHKNITLFMGFRIQSFIKSGKRVSGIRASTLDNELMSFRAPLVIGADGRNSEVTKLANGTIKKTDNERIALFSYFSTGTKLTQSHVWSLRQGQEYIGLFPNRQRILISWYLPRHEYESKQETHEQSFKRLINFIAKQGINVGDQLESIIVVKDSSPQSVRLRLNALALVGDTKLTADPLTGIGCTWAMQSAKLLSVCLGKPPSSKQHPFIRSISIQTRLNLYSASHILLFKFTSAFMTFVSMHGKWVFNKPVYRFLAWCTGKRKPNQ